MNDWVNALTAYDDGSSSGAALVAGGYFLSSPAGDSFIAKWGCAAPRVGYAATYVGATPESRSGLRVHPDWEEGRTVPKLDFSTDSPHSLGVLMVRIAEGSAGWTRGPMSSDWALTLPMHAGKEGLKLSAATCISLIGAELEFQVLTPAQDGLGLQLSNRVSLKMER